MYDRVIHMFVHMFTLNMRFRHVLALFVMGFVFFWGYILVGYAAEESVTSDRRCTTVRIHDEGFSPNTVIIPVNTCITWISEGQNSHWPASDFHPTHTIYPTEDPGCIGSALDACVGLREGQGYTFVFQKPGFWGVHDHLYPGFSMRIEVIGEEIERASIKDQGGFFEKIVSFLQQIPEYLFRGVAALLDQARSLFGINNSVPPHPSPESFRVLPVYRQHEIMTEFAKANPSAAWEYLKEVFFVNGQVVGNAHQYAHIVGNEAYRHMGFEGSFICDDTFAYGCYHGVTEKLLQEQGPGVLKEVEEACTRMFPPEETIEYTGCIHGSGHGLFSWATFDTKTALEQCDIFSPQFRNYCYDGVFMEHSFSAPKTDLDPQDPWRFCSDLPEQYHHNCARYQVQLFMAVFGWDLTRTAAGCAEAPNAILQNTCFEDFGYMVTQRSESNIDTVKKLCALMPSKEGEYWCTIGAATEFVFQEYQGWREISKTLCEELPEPWEQHCLKNRQNTMQRYGRTP